MTNYEKIFNEQMKDPQFEKAYYEARLDRIMTALLENLKEQISRDEPKEVLLETINSMQKRLNTLEE